MLVQPPVYRVKTAYFSNITTNNQTNKKNKQRTKKLFCHWFDHIMNKEIYDEKTIIGLWRYNNQDGVIDADLG